MLKIIKLALITILNIIKETFEALRKIYALKRIQRFSKKASRLEDEVIFWELKAFEEKQRFIAKYGEVTEKW